MTFMFVHAYEAAMGQEEEWRRNGGGEERGHVRALITVPIAYNSISSQQHDKHIMYLPTCSS